MLFESTSFDKMVKPELESSDFGGFWPIKSNDCRICRFNRSIESCICGLKYVINQSISLIAESNIASESVNFDISVATV